MTTASVTERWAEQWRRDGFLPVIDELRLQPLPDGYLDYLRLKLRNLSTAPRPDAQIFT